MIILRTVAELRDAVATARRRGARIGIVPTLGAFHEGHLALMRRARERCGLVVVTLFVNPTQFNDAGDLARYPRDEARDAELAASTGADVLFAPDVREVYPVGFASVVEVRGVTVPLEGAVRGPEHFRGVATIVLKLFNMAQPDEAFFGQKDAQQALLIRRMVRDLDVPVRIEVCPTVREADGLAMSSRNALLAPEARQRAPALHEALAMVASLVEQGAHIDDALARARAFLALHGVDPEYFAAVSADTLEPVHAVDVETLVAIAARFGAVRLIDNVLLHAPGRGA